jgi:hypothetical protein
MIICDLDGCIADDRHRRHLIGIAGTHLIDAPDDLFLNYHLNCEFDNACEAALEFLRLRERNDVFYVTGRPERVRRQTESWLKARGLRYADLIMRDGPGIGTVELKKKAALILLSVGHTIDSAYDDRQDVVDAYRSLGIRATVIKVEQFDGN